MPFSQKNTEFDKQCRTAAAELGTPYFFLLSSSPPPALPQSDAVTSDSQERRSGFRQASATDLVVGSRVRRFDSVSPLAICLASLPRAWINSHPVQQKDVKGTWNKRSTTARSSKLALVSPINQKQQRRQAPGESPPPPNVPFAVSKQTQASQRAALRWSQTF